MLRANITSSYFRKPLPRTKVVLYCLLNRKIKSMIVVMKTFITSGKTKVSRVYFSCCEIQFVDIEIIFIQGFRNFSINMFMFYAVYLENCYNVPYPRGFIAQRGHLRCSCIYRSPGKVRNAKSLP